MANNNDKFISRENAKTLWGYMIDLLTGKQNKLTFDETPTQSSDNPVKSGGIFTALAGKGTYSKPSGGIPKSDLASAVQTSLGKADTALQTFTETDPTVPTWAKATNKPSYTQDEVGDGTTYKRVNQTEKDTWSGKQNALTTTQMNAVNSGITSAGVAQISTNQANILSTQQSTIGENLLPCPYYRKSGYTSNGVTITYGSDGIINIDGDATAHAWFALNVSYEAEVGETYTVTAISSNADSAVRFRCFYTNGAATSPTEQLIEAKYCNQGSITFTYDPPTGLKLGLQIYILKNTSADNEKITFMFEKGSVAHPYQPYMLSRQNLFATKAPALSRITAIDSGSLDDVAENTFAVYASTVTNVPTLDDYYVETIVYDTSNALQKAYNYTDGTSYVRVKNTATWGNWKQITNA